MVPYENNNGTVRPSHELNDGEPHLFKKISDKILKAA